VQPLSVGQTLIATWEPESNHRARGDPGAGLEFQVIFNKGAVMVLPSGVNKKTGLLPRSNELGIGLHNVVGRRDAENDHAFLNAL
jgi:hydroxymethylpyrimidine pyrophosphatase-like HAD family hydrolase